MANVAHYRLCTKTFEPRICNHEVILFWCLAWASKALCSEMWVRVTRVTLLLIWAKHAGAGGILVERPTQTGSGIQEGLGELPKYFSGSFLGCSFCNASTKIIDKIECRPK